MAGNDSAGRRGWPRAVGLSAAAVFLSILNPLVLIAIPFALLVFFLAARRTIGLVLLAAAGVALVASGDPSSGLWYVERGWAVLLGGCFLALSIRWPEGRFFPRGLGAVVGAFLFMALILGVRPGEWEVLDWVVRSRAELAMSSVIQEARLNLGPEVVTRALEDQVLSTIALQSVIFPALQGLSSLAGLGLSWWLFKRLSGGSTGGIGALREFRFNDQLVWILIFGIMALLVSSGAMARVGVNAVFFMGALYALRGVAVILFLSGGLSLFGGILLLLGLLLIAPFAIMGAVVIGLGDTWFDLRTGRGSSGSEA